MVFRELRENFSVVPESAKALQSMEETHMLRMMTFVLFSAVLSIMAAVAQPVDGIANIPYPVFATEDSTVASGEVAVLGAFPPSCAGQGFQASVEVFRATLSGLVPASVWLPGSAAAPDYVHSFAIGFRGTFAGDNRGRRLGVVSFKGLEQGLYVFFIRNQQLLNSWCKTSDQQLLVINGTAGPLPQDLAQIRHDLSNGPAELMTPMDFVPPFGYVPVYPKQDRVVLVLGGPNSTDGFYTHIAYQMIDGEWRFWQASVAKGVYQSCPNGVTVTMPSLSFPGGGVSSSHGIQMLKIDGNGYAMSRPVFDPTMNYFEPAACGPATYATHMDGVTYTMRVR